MQKKIGKRGKPMIESTRSHSPIHMLTTSAILTESWVVLLTRNDICVGDQEWRHAYNNQWIWKSGHGMMYWVREFLCFAQVRYYITLYNVAWTAKRFRMRSDEKTFISTSNIQLHFYIKHTNYTVHKKDFLSSNSQKTYKHRTT